MLMCVSKVAQVGEVDRARAIWVHASSLSDPRNDPGFWADWNKFEVRQCCSMVFMPGGMQLRNLFVL